jgi:hypothetical protein
VLDVDLLGLVADGWRDHRELAIAARRSLAAPGRVMRVDVAAHRITASRQPAATIEVDRHELVTVGFALATDFEVTGRCDAVVTLAIQGTNAATRRAHLDLAALTPASLGFRLLPARAYAIAQEIEESAEQLTYRRAS